MVNVVYNYGWLNATSPYKCGYIEPEILNILSGLGIRNICDLGSSNGALANVIYSAGYYVTGVKYDKQGF
jgi:hypothetical protein